MTTTIGRLVSELYARYERLYHDPELAARATAVVVAELLAARAAARLATAATHRAA